MTKSELPDLSDDAKMLLACTFALGMTDLTYQMKESRPSDRAQAALDELVQKGVLLRESINMAGGIGFKPKGFDLTPIRAWFRKNGKRKDLAFPLATPLKGAA